MRAIDADALIEFCAERWIPLNIDAVNMQPTIQPVATDTNVGDTISRQWLMECVNEGWIKFDTEKDENRFIHLVRDIAPSAQPEPTDIDAKEAVYNLAEKIGIHQLFALTVELRGEPIQPEPTYEQVEEYCKKRCLHVVTADFFESTKPQRLGHWIKHIDPFGGEQYECSECGVLWEFADGTPEDNEAYFCPKCGAKMKGVNHETD